MVFKKLADRLHSASTAAANAVSNALAPADQQQQRQYTNEIRQLESMGFVSERARHALNATGGNVDRAAELLLLSAEGDDGDGGDTGRMQQPRNDNNRDGGGTVAGGEGPAVTARNDEQMKRAIEESLQSLSPSQQQQQQQHQCEVIDLTMDEGITKKITKQKKKIQPSSSSNTNSTELRDTAHVRAKKATLSQTHPTIQLPDKLTNKSKEEQILRLVNRILITTTSQQSSSSNNVMSIDTLHRTLVAVRSNPLEPKFRTIDRNNANYNKYIRNVPGAEELLQVMNYRLLLDNNEREVLQLDRQFVDDALLYLAISALEMARTKKEYILGKKLHNFQNEMKRIGTNSSGAYMTENETSTRLDYMSKCPREPKEGGGGTRVDVYLGNSTNEAECNDYGGHVHRRFDGDDTLEDILYWLGGCYGSELLDKLRGTSSSSGGSGNSGNEGGIWCLCDLNTVPITPLDVVKHRRKTLQYLGLFPSCKLGVRLSDDSWKEGEGGGELNNIISGSARGLGAASRSMLY